MTGCTVIFRSAARMRNAQAEITARTQTGGGSLLSMRVFLKNVSAVWAVNFVNGALGIAFVPIAVHRLGAAGYGLLSIYTVVAGYVALTDLGIGPNLQRLLAGRPDGPTPGRPESVFGDSEAWRRQQIQTAWGLYLLLSVGLLVVLLVLMHIVPTYLFPVGAGSRRAVQWLTLFAVIDFVLGVPVLLMQNTCAAAERFGRYSRFTLASGLIRYSLMFAGVLLTTRPELVAAAITARRLVGIPLALQGLLPRLLALSWIAYGVLAIAGALLGPTVLGAIGLGAAEYTTLFVILIGALSFNAHGTTAYAFQLAAGRPLRAATLGLVSLTLLFVTFFVARAAGAGLLAIAWAWVVSQLVYAFAIDLTALRQLEVPVRPLRDTGLRVAVVLAVALVVLARA